MFESPDVTALLKDWSAPEWISARVFWCGVIGVGLLVLALVMRGVQKLVTLVAIGFLALGGYWWVRDAMTGDAVLPNELEAELKDSAKRSLSDEDARRAWAAVKKDWQQAEGSARERLAKGGDAARATIARQLSAKIAELRAKGDKTAAEELARLRAEVDPQRQRPTFNIQRPTSK